MLYWVATGRGDDILAVTTTVSHNSQRMSLTSCPHGPTKPSIAVPFEYHMPLPDIHWSVCSDLASMSDANVVSSFSSS